ncbi:MAG TPA: VWA domain-containing protein [Opitutaceae bacterium]|nr:VWA domain-containing protein [Opitutaceae bacterium]
MTPAIGDLRLADPAWLLLLLVLPLVVWLRGRRGVPVLLVPFAAAWHRPSLAAVSRWPVLLALSGLTLLTGALARPQRIEDKHEAHSRGYDIMLAIDLSGSMLSEDYEKDGQRINRLQAVRPVIQAFIDRRPADRIGVVLFSGRAYTLSPLTTDHSWLSRQLGRVHIGLIEDGTAIGDAIGVAVSRLDQAAREINGHRLGAFIVLLTDGVNNRGSLSPLQAANIAQARGIPVYTVGAGKDGLVPYPVFDDNGNKIGERPIPSDLDEDSLREISRITGGHFYRAADTGTIESAFASIDQSQKIEFQAKSYLMTTELFGWLAAPGTALLLAAGLMTQLRRETRP